ALPRDPAEALEIDVGARRQDDRHVTGVPHRLLPSTLSTPAPHWSSACRPRGGGIVRPAMTGTAQEPPSIGEFDYVIVGAGAAGCLLANRLSRDPRTRVLLIEAGGEDDWIWLHIPAGYLQALGNPRADWMLMTESEPGLGGRQLNYPRGKVLGGSTAINGMIYMRGQAADYDGWRQLGLTGWGWDDVLPLFKRHEDHFLGSDDN